MAGTALARKGGGFGCHGGDRGEMMTRVATAKIDDAQSSPCTPRSRRIAAAHRGTIYMESVRHVAGVERGCRFVVELPRSGP